MVKFNHSEPRINSNEQTDSATAKGVAQTIRRKLLTALLRQHRRQEDAGSRLNPDLPAPPWNTPNPGAQSEPWRGKRNADNDEELNPFPARKDPKGPTNADNVDDTDPELPLAEEASESPVDPEGQEAPHSVMYPRCIQTSIRLAQGLG